MRMALTGAKPVPADFCSLRFFRVVSLPIFPHKMFVDEKACEEKADLQLDSPLFQTSQPLRLRICRCGSYLLFQKLPILLWTNCDATSLCYCPAEEVTVSVGRRGTEEEVSPSLNSSDSTHCQRSVWNGWPCWCLKWVTLAVAISGASSPSTRAGRKEKGLHAVSLCQPVCGAIGGVSSFCCPQPPAMQCSCLLAAPCD